MEDMKASQVFLLIVGVAGNALLLAAVWFYVIRDNWLTVLPVLAVVELVLLAVYRRSIWAALTFDEVSANERFRQRKQGGRGSD
jgi:uncharacterized membrane protein